LHPKSPCLVHLRQPPNRPLKPSFPLKPILAHENHGRNQEFSKRQPPNRFRHANGTQGRILGTTDSACTDTCCAGTESSHVLGANSQESPLPLPIWHADVPKWRTKGGFCVPETVPVPTHDVPVPRHPEFWAATPLSYPSPLIVVKSSKP